MSKILLASEFSECSDVKGTAAENGRNTVSTRIFAIAVMLSELLPGTKILQFMNQYTVNI